MTRSIRVTLLVVLCMASVPVRAMAFDGSLLPFVVSLEAEGEEGATGYSTKPFDASVSGSIPDRAAGPSIWLAAPGDPDGSATTRDHLSPGKVLLIVVVGEGIVAANAAIASQNPLAFGIVSVAVMCPLMYVVERSAKRPTPWAGIVVFGAIGALNIALSTGHHSDVAIFNYNMLAWNGVGGLAYLGSKLFGKKPTPSAAVDSGGQPGWSVGFATAGRTPVLRAAYRF